MCRIWSLGWPILITMCELFRVERQIHSILSSHLSTHFWGWNIDVEVPIVDISYFCFFLSSQNFFLSGCSCLVCPIHGFDGVVCHNDIVPSTPNIEFDVCSLLSQQHFLCQELNFELRNAGREGVEALWSESSATERQFTCSRYQCPWSCFGCGLVCNQRIDKASDPQPARFRNSVLLVHPGIFFFIMLHRIG